MSTIDMSKKYFKIIQSILIAGIFLFIAFGSNEDDESNKDEVKTDFSNCTEVIDYVKYRGYQSLKDEWGDARLGDIGMDNSGNFEIEVIWDKVKVNGNTVEFTFTRSQTSNTPMNFVNAYCGN
jgi:hypothetical protein